MDKVKQFRLTATSGGGFPCHWCRWRLQAGDLTLIVESQYLDRVVCCSTQCAENVLHLYPGSLSMQNHSSVLKSRKEADHVES